jgi:hypothetical protein
MKECKTKISVYEARNDKKEAGVKKMSKIDKPITNE